MSLEEALLANTAAISRNSELLEKLVARAEAAAAAAGGAAASTTAAASETKGKGKGKGKTETETTSTEGAEGGETGGTSEPTLTHAEVKTMLGTWLAEFKEKKDDPETEARREAVKKALFSLTKKEGALVTDVPVADLPRVVAWLDKKKEADAGHGQGRLTAKPEAEAAAGGDDDI